MCNVKDVHHEKLVLLVLYISLLSVVATFNFIYFFLIDLILFFCKKALTSQCALPAQHQTADRLSS